MCHFVFVIVGSCGVVVADVGGVGVDTLLVVFGGDVGVSDVDDGVVVAVIDCCVVDRCVVVDDCVVCVVVVVIVGVDVGVVVVWTCCCW